MGFKGVLKIAKSGKGRYNNLVYACIYQEKAVSLYILSEG